MTLVLFVIGLALFAMACIIAFGCWLDYKQLWENNEDEDTDQ